MASPSAIDAGLLAVLLADSALMAIATDGIWRDVAPQGARRFVIYSLQASRTERIEGGIAYEVPIYLVKCVLLDKSGNDVNTAANRIDALLENNGAGAALSITGYGLITTGRIEDNWRVRYSEPDDDNKDLRWQHAGGLYEVWAQPN